MIIECCVSAILLHVALFMFCLPGTYSHICRHASFCETYFQRFTDLQLPGCGATATSSGQTSHGCARSCFTNQGCTAFDFGDNVCKTCPGDLATGLTFVPGQSIFLQRTMMVSHLYYDPGTLLVNKVIPIPGGISSGRVGYLHATVLANNSFNIDFAQDFAVKYINFHFKARWESDDNRKIVLNFCSNRTWGVPAVSSPFPFPFTVDMPFTLHVLVTPKSFDVYINANFCCYYNHTLAVGDVRYIRVLGNLNVHEMSV
ncbi:unnamed protein product [Lymnaea stagnalis]|uniref:Galectin n=1 Tax=Lymnaea stagnalis TaxID=6523 RepID=A0AAV2HK11_LYMST